MPERIFDRSIYFDVSMFDNLQEKGRELICIFDRIIEGLMCPFGRKLVIDTQKINGRQRMYRFNESNWGKVCGSLKNGDMQHVLIITDEDNSGEKVFDNPAMSSSVTCNYRKEFEDIPLERVPITNNFAFSLSERLFGEKIPSEIQDRMVQFFKTTFEALNGVNGFLTFEKKYARFIPNETGLEALLRLYYPRHSQHFRKIARGYFWGNIITEGHIEQLGGIEAVRNNQVCYQTELLKFDSRVAAYLQLTPDINNYSDNQLRDLKRFMAPILPKEDMSVVKRTDPHGRSKEWSRLVFDRD